MSQPIVTAGRSRLSPVPVVWALVCVIAFGSAFYAVSWPFVDVYRTLTDATAFDWPEAVATAFTPEVEYRPLFTLAVKLAYELFGVQIWWYQTLVLTQFAAVLALVIWLLRPVGFRRALASCIALSCIVGLHTSRILFGFWPLNFGSFVLVLLLIAIAMALEGKARSWIYFPLVLIALLSLEWGVLIVVLVPVLWMAGAPGLGRRAVLWTGGATVAYAAIRLLVDPVGTPSFFYTESGFGFSELSPEDLQTRFGQAPWVFWLYNVSSSFLTVVASEPRSGVFAFASTVLEGNVPYWRWFHVGSSLVTTAAIATALSVFRPQGRDRLVVVTGLGLLVVGSGLGLLYTRDRLGLMPGVGYGVLLYVAMASLLERLPQAGWRRWAVGGAVAIIGVAWGARSVETYFQLRDTAWDFHHEWEERAAELDQATEPDRLLTALRSAALSRTPTDPRLDPTWTHVLFERRFPIGASRPLSTPFDIRWGPAVRDDARRHVEVELGLTDARLVERDPRQRTWTYRLRRPTHARVRAVLTHPAVEDTARIDAERLEILE